MISVGETKGVEVECMGRRLRFKGIKDSDEILELMRKTKSLYEIEVLESVRDRLTLVSRKGLVIDVGAFIGTHSVYFALFCGVSEVLAYEADSLTFKALNVNMGVNGVDNVVTCVNKALGARRGVGSVVRKDKTNTSANYVKFVAAENLDQVEVARLDDELLARNSAPVQLIKIDVEGAEVAVLKGAREVICRSRPLLCVEVLTASRLFKVLYMLRKEKYAVLDCLGYVPTYILESVSEMSWVRRVLMTPIWLLRAAIPQQFFRSRWYLKRLARSLL
jgi:FkbM family methyltransferase